MTCCSSAHASAQGTPSSSAELLTTHSVLPPNESTERTALVVLLTAPLMVLRVCGETMSRSAYSRSASDSSVGS